MHLLAENQLINNKWTVERLLGEGAFAEVYRVRHNIFGRQAMKVFKRVGMKIEEVEEILYEPVLLANINHPNIIRVFDADTTETPKGRCCFFTMEYIAGGTLERFWKSFGDQFVPVQGIACGQNYVHVVWPVTGKVAGYVVGFFSFVQMMGIVENHQQGRVMLRQLVERSVYHSLP